MKINVFRTYTKDGKSIVEIIQEWLNDNKDSFSQEEK